MKIVWAYGPPHSGNGFFQLVLDLWHHVFRLTCRHIGKEAGRLVSRLRYGNTNTFFLRGTKANLLVDTDNAGTLFSFYKEIKKHRIQINEITYVLATHYHPDHVGLVSQLMRMGVTLLLVDVQREYIHYPDEIFRRDQHIKYVPIREDNALLISCEESRAFLDNMGIQGEIISTPSHSGDSISLILDNGDCFVGDLEPIDYLNAYEGNVKLKEDWDLIMGYKPKMIFYAHANERVIP